MQFECMEYVACMHYDLNALQVQPMQLANWPLAQKHALGLHASSGSMHAFSLILYLSLVILKGFPDILTHYFLDYRVFVVPTITLKCHFIHH